ncbi:hypothetical protein CL630_03850 [bacterium]|nr:hypothetical protein [bacterium]|tara:strand:- start:50585 stop:51337 length:753 start_codon:yes stop_codon:yes gene_type:complete
MEKKMTVSQGAKARKTEQVKEASVTETELVNIDVAQKAISMAHDGASLKHQNTSQESPGHFTLTGVLKGGNAGGLRVQVIVLWPEGQDGHGSVKVSFGEEKEHNPTLSDRKYACWKNRKGEIELVKWREPPECYKFQLKYGVKWPRNKRSVSFIPLIGVWLIFSLFVWFVAVELVSLLMESLDFSKKAVKEGSLLAGAFGITVGSLLASMANRNDIEGSKKLAWEEYLKENRNSDEQSTTLVKKTLVKNS